MSPGLTENAFANAGAVGSGWTMSTNWGCAALQMGAPCASHTRLDSTGSAFRQLRDDRDR